MSGAAVAVVVAVLTAVCGVGSAIGTIRETHYHLAKKITLGGEGGWDYFDVDSIAHRVFIPRRTHTMIVDEGGKIVGDLPIVGSHAIAFAPEFNRAFTSDNEEHTVTIIGLAKLQVMGKVKIPGRNPDGILYDPS